MTTIKTPKEKLNLNLSREAKAKAKRLAADLNISTSHLIEGFIMGMQIMPGQKEQEKN